MLRHGAIYDPVTLRQIGYRRISRAGKVTEEIWMGWQSADKAESWKTYLTIHEQDLFPVAAFKTDDEGTWLREMEGPEDLEPVQNGRYEELYRPPTHIMLLEDLPSPGDTHG